MTTHIFGMILTHQGTFSNNRGEGEGTTNTLQKVIREGDLYSTVSAEAIRYALREQWQERGKLLNRRTLDHRQVQFDDTNFNNWHEKLDDDVLGFMHAQKETVSRRGNLEVTRAVSTTPWAGEIIQNFASPGSNPSTDYATGNGGLKNNVDPHPYAVEVHHTRYQFGFGLIPEALGRKRNCDEQGQPEASCHSDEERDRRVQATLEGLCNLRRVGGAHARYFSDYSPEAIILRVTDDPAPRMLYCFRQSDTGEMSIRELINKVEAGDIAASELVIGTTLNIGELGDVETNGDDSDEKDKVKDGPLEDAYVVKGVKRAVQLCIELYKDRISSNQQEGME